MIYPDDWQEKTLGEIAKEPLSYGINAPAVNYDSRLPSYIRITDITEDGHFNDSDKKSVIVKGNEKKYTLKYGDILLARTGASVGKSYLYNEKDGNLIFAGFLIKLSVDTEKYNPKFIFGQLQTKRYWDWVASVSMRSGQPGINSKEYSSFKIFLPPLDEQNKIAETLSNFDECIDDLAALIKKKKNIRAAALEDLINRKIRLPGFSSDWQEVSFNQVIIPKARIGWQGLKKHEYLKKGYAYLIGGTDFKNGTVCLDNIWQISKKRYEMDSNIQVSAGNVLVTKDGTIGKIALVPKLNKTATLNSGVFVFRTSSHLQSEFLYRILTSSVFKNFIDTLSAGSTIKHLYQKDLKNFRFSIPIDIEEQKVIAEILTAMDEEINALTEEREKIIAIRAGAMDELLTGKIRLK